MYMENIVNRIIAIDKSAQLKLEKACAMRDEILEKNKAECEKMQSSFKTQADKALLRYSEYRKNEYSEKSAALRAVYEEKVREMNENFENNHSAIEEEIFKTIVGEHIG